ncbi:hypothetical protein GCM10020331_090810 [Ectobacillus funiculus]
MKEIHTINVETITDENGQRIRKRDSRDGKKVWPAQLVLLAIGFSGPEQDFLQKNERRNR